MVDSIMLILFSGKHKITFEGLLIKSFLKTSSVVFAGLSELLCRGSLLILIRKKKYFSSLVLNSSRNITKRSSGYEGAGKTTAQILNIEEDNGILIDGYSKVGFRLNNNVKVLGPMAIFPGTLCSWNIQEYKEINEESLSLFTIIEPKLDILVIGYGDKNNDWKCLDNIMITMRKHKLACELMPTDKAIHTFNYLVSEGRFVAAALIPPNTVTNITEDDMFMFKRIYSNFYDEAK